MRRSAFALAAGLTIVVIVADVLLYTGQPQDGRVALSPTPPPSSSPTASASPAPVLDDRFGFVSISFTNPPQVWRVAVQRESDARPTHDLLEGLAGRTVVSNYGIPSSYGLAVSPDGRRLAYWTVEADQFPLRLQVLDLTPGARPRTLVTLTPEFGDVVGESVVWSSDGTGLVIGVGTSPLRCGCCNPSCPPKDSALYLLDTAGGKPREIARIRGESIVPVAWDRQARVVAAFEFELGGGVVIAYDVIPESGATVRTPMVIGAGGTVTVEASSDAKQVLAHEYSSPGQVVRVWPLAAPERAVVLTPRGEQIFAPARWRPGTAEIGVLFGDRLELWDAAGGRRRVPLPASPPDYRPFFFRIDGSAALMGTYGQTSRFVAVELASGRSAAVPGEYWLSSSVRIGQ